MFRLCSKPKPLHIYRNLLGNVQNHSPKKCKHVTNSENRLLGKTHSSKVDLIWHLRPIRKVENARVLILFLSCFLQELDSDDQTNYFYSTFWSQPQFLIKPHFFIWSHLWFISCRTYEWAQQGPTNEWAQQMNEPYIMCLETRFSANPCKYN